MGVHVHVGGKGRKLLRKLYNLWYTSSVLNVCEPFSGDYMREP